MGLGTWPSVWYFFAFSLFLLGLVTKGQQCGISLFLLFLMGLGTLAQQCGISLFLLYFYWD
jgi:hypothetical protein